MIQRSGTLEAVTPEPREHSVAQPRAAALREPALALGAAILVGSLAASQGGYFPTAWGWAGTVLAWVVLMAVALQRRFALTRLEVAFAGGLTAFVGWVAVSAVWSESVPATVLEVQRDLVYVLAVAAILLLTRHASIQWLLGGVLLAVSVIAIYSLGTRLLPDRIGTFNAIAGYRLSTPIGYWNGLGLFCALGALLAAGIVAHGRTVVGRALAGAPFVVLITTLYFTFGRGPWIALGFGILVAIALDRERLRLVTALLVLAAPSAAAVALASRSHALTTQTARLDEAARQGHRLLVWIVLLAAASGAAAAAFALAADRIRPLPTVRVAYVAALFAGVAAGLVLLFATYGGPATLARKGYDAFARPNRAIAPNESLTKRLFDLSSTGRVDQWRAAWDDFRDHPWLGSGAGTYEGYWLRLRPVPTKVRDAHNLYLEVLGEMGPVGLALLAATLLVPLIGAVRLQLPQVAPAAGAYAAYLLHAAGDWDWELPAVTLTALVCGVAVLVARRDGELEEAAPRAPARAAIAAAALAIGGFAFVGLVGNKAASESRDAIEERDYSHALREARRATDWAPWASEGWRLAGEAELALGNTPAAARSFRHALAKDRHAWDLWVELGNATNGAPRRRAYAQARRLNPFGFRELASQDLLGGR